MNKYVIVNATTTEELSQAVNLWIETGYRPEGGISVLKETEKRTVYFQVMVYNNA